MSSALQTQLAHESPLRVELSSPAFCGPLALLLELIEQRRLPITEVSLAEVTDQYLERMRLLVGVDPELLADFLVIAAKLLVIKSRELLPSKPSLSSEEPGPATDLQQMLLEYSIFREAAEKLRQLEESGRRTYPRRPVPASAGRIEPALEPVPPEALRAAMERMLRAIQRPAGVLELSRRVSVQERMEQLLTYLSARCSATFAEIAGNSIDAIVATFLAVLELLRRGEICAEQEAPFAEIRLSLARTSTG